MTTLAPTITEAEVQRAVLRVLSLHGWATWRIGQRNARGTQDPGVPDIYALHHEHGALWIEVKRPGGRQSAHQERFEELSVGAGQSYWLISDAAALHRLLTEMREATHAS